ncbi:uncharacterized protein LY89DRAFT_670401 [Mollisia scopiformis]|uniref:F-box domain-containing protein n=1 Tax=Mollisia scopiformis TaxID=149040 RepID=A0A194X7S3_MOLSC|nr:uncharacterized protein LY89DRAFT_670401 [Mollisia scopiformis]KUJ15862.1 hypothetical protein LY89DRAFT_670401 [Mollisia scopiformis]
MMLLLDLPNEVLDSIFSYSRVRELRSLILCSRHVHTLALPHLYHDINFTVRAVGINKQRSLWATRIVDRFIATLESHPERASWVTSASLTWDKYHSDFGLSKVLGLLTSANTITLKVELNAYPDIPSQPAAPPWESEGSSSRASHLLSQSRTSRTLKSLVLDDPQTTTADVARIMALPALTELTIVQFNEWKSRDVFAPLQNTITPPSSNVCKLHFLNFLASNYKISENLFKNQTQLETLTWDVMTEYKLSPSVIRGCLHHLRDNLLELHLTRAYKPDMPMLGPDSTELDVLQFSCLKVLEIHSHFLFPAIPWHDRPKGQRDWTSSHTVDLQLSNRLPATLEFLKIWFEYREYAFKPWKLGDESHEWIISLAQQSQSRTPKLSNVMIIEKRWASEREWLPWVPIAEVHEPFDKAKIELEVWLRGLVDP